MKAIEVGDVNLATRTDDAGTREEYIEAIRRVSGLDLSAAAATKPKNVQNDQEFIDAIRRVSGGNLLVTAKRGDSTTLLGNAQAGVIEATRRIRYAFGRLTFFFSLCSSLPETILTLTRYSCNTFTFFLMHYVIRFIF